MRADYALDGESGCIADARHHATAFIDRARNEHHVRVSARSRDLTELVVSELVTNACRHASGPVLLELRIGAEAMDVVVGDSSPTAPAAMPADPSRVGRHGLEIVRAVAESLRVEQNPDGKRITARIALADAAR